MSKNFNFDAKKIYEQEFSLDFKGYSPVEVDRLLDKIIEDYLLFDQTIDNLVNEQTRLQRELANKEANIIELQAKIKALQTSEDSEAASQVDILKRIARLEAIVYNKE